MPFPRKYQHLIEIGLGGVDAPDYVWLTYAVCAVTAEGCGWGGWMIEAALRHDGEKHPTSIGDRLLPAVDDQICPRCGRETYRTGATIRLVPSADQSSPLASVEYSAPPYDQPIGGCEEQR